MKKTAVIFYSILFFSSHIVFISCNENRQNEDYVTNSPAEKIDDISAVDTTKIPKDQFGEAVKYGRQLLINTAYYIGPNGINGKYLGNKMNCNNCHQEAGTKLYSFNLMRAHSNYPQYRARENKVLTLAERINNCVMRPHNGRPLPLDSKEMVAILSYLKWLSTFAPKTFKGSKNLEVDFPSVAASPGRGEALYIANCSRCHAADGGGAMRPDNITFTYPPLWGKNSYQPGSSMHRIIKQAQWMKANMPYDKATAGKPFLSDAEAMDIAAFINDDEIHKRPGVKNLDYPVPATKAIDYGEGPFADTFTVAQHKYGPYTPIINYWNAKGLNPVF